jgi:hypothetical protein
MTLKQLLAPLATVLLLSAFSTQALAQQHSYIKKKDKKEGGSFGSHLWYGGGINLGFASGFGSSQFGIGVSPMVGYKFWGPFSVGPRVSVDYLSFKAYGTSLGLVNTEAGIFLRARVFKGLFLQGDLMNEWIQTTPDGYNKFKYQRFGQLLGLGYNFGNGEGGPGYEIALHYNFAVDKDQNASLTGEQALKIRFAFTYKF